MPFHLLAYGWNQIHTICFGDGRECTRTLIKLCRHISIDVEEQDPLSANRTQAAP